MYLVYSCSTGHDFLTSFLPGSLQKCFMYATNRIKMSYYKISISKDDIDTRSSLEAFYARVTFSLIWTLPIRYLSIICLMLATSVDDSVKHVIIFNLFP